MTSESQGERDGETHEFFEAPRCQCTGKVENHQAKAWRNEFTFLPRGMGIKSPR